MSQLFDANGDLRFVAIGRRFKSQFSGVCTIDRDHPIKRGDWVTRVEHADNPFIPVTGVACKYCLSVMEHH